MPTLDDTEDNVHKFTTSDDDAISSATADDMVNHNEALPVNPYLVGMLVTLGRLVEL